MKNPLGVTREQIENDTRFTAVNIYSSVEILRYVIAREIVDLIKEHNAKGEMTRLIVPVGGPMDYRLIAQMCNKERVSCKNLVLFNMDEVLTPEGELVPKEHPFSFRSYMDRMFYQILAEDLGVKPENRIFPDPHDLNAVQRKIDAVGGIDVCYGGFGIVGHIAYNEPVEDQELNGQSYAELPTRIVKLSRETITQAAMLSDGDLEGVPRQAITIGMKEILGARELHLCFMRPWHAAIMRRALYGPMTPSCPASYLQLHQNIRISMVETVARVPKLYID